jgi:hypothetical protein
MLSKYLMQSFRFILLTICVDLIVKVLYVHRFHCSFPNCSIRPYLATLRIAQTVTEGVES